MVGQQLLGLVGRSRLVVDIEPPLIPDPGERPERGRGHHGPEFVAMDGAPLPGFVFRPEETDGASGEADVVPELSGGDHEMDARGCGQQLPTLHLEANHATLHHGFGLDDGVSAQ